MDVFVTGAAGYIGSVVTEVFLANGHRVVGFDNLKYGHREAVDPKAGFQEGDLRDRALLDDIFCGHKFDAVIHLAAEAYIDESISNPGLFFDVNTSGSLNLLLSMQKVGCRNMIFSSTAAVYGEPVEIPMTEDHPKEPVNTYGESKLQFERTMEWFRKGPGLNHVSLRYFNACGATQAHGEARRKETHIIPLLFDAATGKRGKFTLFGTDYPTQDGTCLRDYVHVLDIAEAHLAALERIEELGSRAYNIGSGRGYTNRQVIESVKNVTGAQLTVEEGPRRAGDPARLVASHDKIKAELGWSPRFTELDSMVRSSWEWRRAHPNGYSQ